MHVTRLISAGKIKAKKVGRAWMIEDNAGSINQINFEKTTSLQKWGKLIEAKFDKKLKIEASKDREVLYARLYNLGLPHERHIAFQFGKFPSKKEFEIAVGRIGKPYWISAVPNLKARHLDRQSKLRLYDINTGYRFLSKLPEKENYKIIVCQYPDKPEFKGTVLVSESGNGIAEFITGDRHYIMTRGFTLTDPFLFNQQGVIRFSKTISKTMQKRLYELVRGIHGHLEVQYGIVEGNKELNFFDYNDEEAYIEIDELWNDLKRFFKKAKRKTKKEVVGLPASLGVAEGKCTVVSHENPGIYDSMEKGNILVSDTTTPEMTPLMAKASAIVTDLGGVTSHAAIVCRELGIPAIVGTRNATEVIQTGDRVKVDAHKGVVQLLD